MTCGTAGYHDEQRKGDQKNREDTDALKQTSHTRRILRPESIALRLPLRRDAGGVLLRRRRFPQVPTLQQAFPSYGYNFRHAQTNEF
jgi:hypothetical protein